MFRRLHQWRGIAKQCGKMQVTCGRKNQAPRSWWQEGARRNQIYKNRIPATFTFCHLHGFWKRFKTPMKPLALEQWREYKSFRNRLICTKPFESVERKVHNHNYLTGEYRGSAHNACNLTYHIDQMKVKIPCIIHNLKGILFLCYSCFHNC